MYKREIMAQLRGWAGSKQRKLLVLRGARQVGKTTLLEEFGKEFDSFISLNLEKDDAEVFRRFKTAPEVWQYVCLKHHITQDRDKRTLLFIDEIQEVPEAVAMLRYFHEDLPWVYVIAAGSRLQVLTKKRISFPVGRVEYLTLRPFSFVEYLEAKGYDDWAESVRGLNAHMLLHEDLTSEFNRYALIGGMPEAVSEYVETGDIERLSPIFNSLVKGYTEDAGQGRNYCGSGLHLAVNDRHSSDRGQVRHECTSKVDSFFREQQRPGCRCRQGVERGLLHPGPAYSRP